MSRCSRKINELKERLDGISGLSDEYIFKKLIQISLIINDIERYADEDILNGTCFKNTELGELIREENKKMGNKGISLLALIITIIIVIYLAGIMIDFDYDYDYAIINLGGEYKKILISSWRDYEGEQIQIKDKNGNIYLTSSYNCTLIKGE